MFGPNHDASPVVLHASELPTTVRTRKPTPIAFSPPQPSDVHVPARRARAPWTVPEWLPIALEGPATFVLGAVAGGLVGVCALAAMTVIMPASSATTRSGVDGAASQMAAIDLVPRAPAPNVRQLLIDGPRFATQRAPVACDAVASAAVTPASEPVVARKPAASRPAATRKTQHAEPQAKRDLLSAGLGS